jgi:hypothetical protein
VVLGGGDGGRALFGALTLVWPVAGGRWWGGSGGGGVGVGCWGWGRYFIRYC